MCVCRAGSSDLGVLVLIATAVVLLHALTNNQYGFHRDELATIDVLCRGPRLPWPKIWERLRSFG